MRIDVHFLSECYEYNRESFLYCLKIYQTFCNDNVHVISEKTNKDDVLVFTNRTNPLISKRYHCIPTV